MKILITGAAGFIGFHAAKKFLNKGIKVHGFDSMNNYYDPQLKKNRLNILKKYKNFSFTKGLLENQKILNQSVLKFKPTIIIHLAAQAGVRYSIVNPDVYLNSNIFGTFNIIKIAQKIKVKHLIIGSSSSVYGANKKIPFQEIDKTDHQVSFYASTKKSTESLAHSYSSLWKLPITMLRFFTVYGPYGRPDMAYFKFTKSILEGKPIDVYNNGEMKRDFTYIDDIIRGIILSIENPPDRKRDKYSGAEPKYRVLNIGNNNPISLDRFISAIEIACNQKAIRNLLPMQLGDVPITFADIDDIKKDLGFDPSTKIEDGIINFVNWYKSYYEKNTP